MHLVIKISINYFIVRSRFKPLKLTISSTVAKNVDTDFMA